MEKSRDEGAPIYQIEEVSLSDIGQELIALAERLRAAGEQIKGRHLLDEPGVSYAAADGTPMTQWDVDEENAQTRSAFRSTLKSLRQFRRQYDRWERLTAEYALTRMGYSQRDAAATLGVAASTINRWAQHPLQVEDYR